MKSRKVTLSVALILCIVCNGLLFGSPLEVANFNQRDDDKDGIANLCDNCWETPNHDQLDSDENCSEPPYSSDPACGDACEIMDDDSIVNNIAKKLLFLWLLVKSK